MTIQENQVANADEPIVTDEPEFQVGNPDQVGHQTRAYPTLEEVDKLLAQFASPEQALDSHAKAREASLVHAANRQQELDWLVRIHDEFLSRLTKKEADSFREYIGVVEKHGAKLLIRSQQDGATLWVSWKDERFVIGV